MHNIDRVESYVKENRIREEGNGLIAIIVGILLLMISIIIVFFLELSTIQIIIFIIIILCFYVIVLSFLFEYKLIKEIISTITKTQDRPVYKEIRVPINKGVRVPVIYEVEKPIIRDVIRTVDRPVLIKEKREKLNIPKYEYLGSTQAKTFHSRNCRLSKLIKRKYKLSNNDFQFFIKKGFVPCKVCIRKLKKI
jgi:hypothetical protein